LLTPYRHGRPFPVIDNVTARKGDKRSFARRCLSVADQLPEGIESEDGAGQCAGDDGASLPGGKAGMLEALHLKTRAKKI
jgi:hypothetical protein